jgi:hypothetical protein
MLKRINYVMSNEEGVSMVEIVVWISVILIIITFFFIFKDNIVEFIKRIFNVMDNKHSGHSYISGV